MLRPRGAGRWLAITRLGLASGMLVFILATVVNVLIGLSPVAFIVATSVMTSDIAHLSVHVGSALSAMW